MNETDKHIRQVLQEGTESFSPDVWKAVSAGIAPVAKKAVVPAWLWGSFAGVAVAAALAVGVFLFPKSNSTQIIENSAVIAENAAEEEVSSAPDEILPLSEQIASTGRTDAVAVAEKPRESSAVRKTTVPEKAIIPEEAPVEASEVPETISKEVPETISEEVPETVSEEVPETSQEVNEEPLPCKPVVSSEPVPEDFEKAIREAYPEKPRKKFSRTAVSLGGHLFGAGGTSSDSQPVYMAAPTSSATLQEGITEQYPEYSFGIPASLGLGFRYDISQSFSVGTGVYYSGLGRSFVGSYKENGTVVAKDADIDNIQHFVGIPLNFYCNFISDDRFKVYVFAGGAAEKLLANDYIIREKDITYHAGSADGFQFSAAAGLGIEYLFTDFLGLYLDPSIRYYFDSGQPRSIRTIQPFMLNFEAGLKFHFGGARK